MPKQETFLKESAGLVTVEVIKTYDPDYAREVFDGLEQDAKEALAEALALRAKYEPEDIPASDGIQYDDDLWEELRLAVCAAIAASHVFSHPLSLRRAKLSPSTRPRKSWA
jgi:hypothetical protein